MAAKSLHPQEKEAVRVSPVAECRMVELDKTDEPTGTAPSDPGSNEDK